MALKIICTVVGLLCLQSSLAFPDGGPIDACIKEKANQPNHGSTSPLPAHTSPYVVEASSNYYRPGQVITVAIEGERFKGFFFQGRDAQTNEWIGSFEQGPENKGYKECSATTHNNNALKDSVVLMWRAPTDRSGEVYFVGSVVMDYKTYWTDIVATVRQ